MGAVLLFADPESGRVDGEVVVDADLDEVQGWLADPWAALAVLDPDATVAPGSPCPEVTRAVEHPLAPLVFTMRWCPTDDGARITLVESEDLGAYDASFSARAVQGGVAIHYELRLVPTFRAPASINRAAAKRQVSTTLQAVARVFADGITTGDLPR
jgi:hypothetical protein